MAFFDASPEVNLIDCPPAMTGEDFGYLLENEISRNCHVLVGESTRHMHFTAKMSPNECPRFAVAGGKFLVQGRSLIRVKCFGRSTG